MHHCLNSYFQMVHKRVKIFDQTDLWSLLWPLKIFVAFLKKILISLMPKCAKISSISLQT